MPEILLKDTNQRRRSRAKDLLFDMEQSRVDPSNVEAGKGK